MRDNENETGPSVEGEGSGRVRRSFRREDRERLLELLDRSGQSVRQFCREHEVAQSSLAKWRRQRLLGTRPMSGRPLVRVAVSKGVEVPSRASAQSSSAAVMIRLAGGAQIETPAGTDVQWLGALCRELVVCSR